jgi:hypothetical protein
MVEVFIDESGNLGKGGKYFVMAAVVCSNNKSKTRLKRILKKACLEFSSTNTPLKEIKSNELSFEQLQEVATKVISKADHEIFILAVEKKHFKTRLENNLSYMYLSGILSKQVLKKYDDDLTITFDARDVKQTSLTAISDYLKIKAYEDWGFKHELSVYRKESHTMYCLQAADFAAHTAYRHYKDGMKQGMKLLSQRIEKTIEYPIGKFGK